MRGILSTIKISSTLIVLVFAFFLSPALAQEHPEHPTQSKKQARKITAETLAQAIEAYVKSEAQKHKGYFLFTDPVEKKELKLTLVKVHKDRLSKIGEDLYFACADFKTPDNQIYDLDIFMKGKTADDLKFTNVWLHKKNGVPRYTWYEENGIWKRKPVKPEKKQP